MIEADIENEYPKDPLVYFTNLLGKPDGPEIDPTELFFPPLRNNERDEDDVSNVFYYQIWKEGSISKNLLVDARQPGPPIYNVRVTAAPPKKESKQ